MSHGVLYLIPVPLGANHPADVLPPAVIERARQLDYFVAENAKTARSFLKSIQTIKPLQDILVKELNEHTPASAMPDLLAPILAGRDAGVVSEAGCPGVADPGAALVAAAHQAGVRIIPLIGPSSLLLALMGSGLNGQQFAFQGYLPVKEEERAKRIRELENESRRRGQVQIFIETPYRNVRLLEALLRHCSPTTRLCLAASLTLPEETLRTLTIAEWQRIAPANRPDIDRRPTVFLLQA